MAGGVSPVVRGRRLAALLRSLRDESHKTAEEAALHLECSTAKISRIENGLVGVRIQDARELLDFYGVHGERREEVLGLVRQARGRGWWYPFTDVMTEGYDQVIGLEDEAAAVRVLETRLIPGLLQTEHYATALIGSRQDVSPDVTERRIQLRMTRQQVLAREEPTVLRVVIDEAALCRQIGSVVVMREQHGHLIAMAETPNVSLRVLPLAGRTHQAAGFSYTIYEFADLADPRVVFEEVFEGFMLRDSAEVTGRYMSGFEHAESCAMTEDESLKFLKHLAARPGEPDRC
jgi:hypothetical protein